MGPVKKINFDCDIYVPKYLDVVESWESNIFVKNWA